jgi:hypothetical protein
MVDGGMGMGMGMGEELEGMTLGGWKWMEKASLLFPANGLEIFLPKMRM